MRIHTVIINFFFFNDTATTEIYTLSLHDALPIFDWNLACLSNPELDLGFWLPSLAYEANIEPETILPEDRKSTRLNSSHANISYAVFCLKKKTTNNVFPTYRANHPLASTTEHPCP